MLLPPRQWQVNQHGYWPSTSYAGPHWSGDTNPQSNAPPRAAGSWAHEHRALLSALAVAAVGMAWLKSK